MCDKTTCVQSEKNAHEIKKIEMGEGEALLTLFGAVAELKGEIARIESKVDSALNVLVLHVRGENKDERA